MSQYNISLIVEELEVVDEFRYLEGMFSKDGYGKAKAESSVSQEKNGDALKALEHWKNSKVEFARGLHERLYVLTQI